MNKTKYLELLLEKLPKPINNDFIQNLEQKSEVLILEKNF